MKTDLLNIKDSLVNLHDIDISKYDESFLNKSLRNRINETKCESPEEYFSILKKNKKEEQLFLDSLQNNYSQFFRNPLTFSVVERIILPSLILKRKEGRGKEIRIWSAACAGGQEAYSLAILMEEYNDSSKSEDIGYRIFATDRCEDQLSAARLGKYDSSALDNLTMKRVKQWFRKHYETYSVLQKLKKKIDFSEFDLFDEQLSCPPASIFGDFDIVVCANLLFYYKPEFRKIILEKTCNSLAKGGYLITGETEREILLNYDCREVYPQSAIFQKK